MLPLQKVPSTARVAAGDFGFLIFIQVSRRTNLFTGGGLESSGKEGRGHPAEDNSPRACSRIV
jgi:hypothetical protein